MCTYRGNRVFVSLFVSRITQDIRVQLADGRIDGLNLNRLAEILVCLFEIPNGVEIDLLCSRDKLC